MSVERQTKLPIVFGAMTIGKPGVEQARVHDLSVAASMLDILQEHGHDEIDTARVYGMGSSEEYLGNLHWQDRRIVMDTKFYPATSYGHPYPGMTFSAEDLRTNLLASLKALKAEKISMWYLHAPDHKVPLEETLKAIDELHKESYFDRFGISNYAAWEVARMNELCMQHGWLRPCVYQGLYNAIHRTVEPELFPCLRHYGMGFYAFNPLAGGWLTPRYHRDDKDLEPGSRFDEHTRQGSLYRKRYWNDAMFDALEILREEAGKLGLTETECALRWMVHHSMLKEEFGDAIIIGASKVEHLRENLADLEKGPLPEEMVRALDRACARARAVAEVYFR